MVMGETFYNELSYNSTLRNNNVTHIGTNLALEEMAH
jgi:hypothetical protein